MSQSSSSPSSLFLRAAPVIFVAIWSTGWVSARYGADYSDPMTFLSLRFAFAFVAIGVIAALGRAEWPRGLGLVHGLISGVLLHAIYLGGVWYAISKGVPAGISGLIAAIQPILTAALAPLLLRERIGLLQWIGIAAGFLGIALVLTPKLSSVDFDTLGIVAAPLLINALAMVSVTAGTFYQKRFIPKGDLRAITALQYIGAFVVVTPVAYLTEPMHVSFTLGFWLVMAWSVFALSFGAIGLLLLLIRRGAVSRAAALIYLVPPSVAVEAYFAFGETLAVVQLIGMALTVVGVALATRR